MKENESFHGVILSKVDIAKRWGISRQAVNHLANSHEDFPKPTTYVANGYTPLYLLEDIQSYEQKRKRKVVSEGVNNEKRDGIQE